MAKEKCCPGGTFITYESTNYFSKIALDYVRGGEPLRRFYAQTPDLEGVKMAIDQKKNFSLKARKVLVENLKMHYENKGELSTHEKVFRNIKALEEPDTYTITTAHQPNIFGGPLYLVYKILHVIQVAEKLNIQFKDQNKYFVPFYYMGSEDADLDEIGQMQVEGKKYIWDTEQTGPVGRMLVDRKLLHLIDELEGQIGIASYGPEFIQLLRKAYQEGALIQEATFTFIHELFGRFGLLILMPDDEKLKKLFEPVVIKELEEGFSHKALEKTTREMEKAGYKVQTHGRPINLFYQEGHSRQRIIKTGEEFSIDGRELTMSKEAILQEVRDHADLFSGNVVLRGPFQETVLPDVIFVGGGGELAYWLEMKAVYEKVDIPYPILLLRNSFLLMHPEEQAMMQKLGLEPIDLFKPIHEIQDKLIQIKGAKIDLKEELEALKDLYEQMRKKAGLADVTLEGHTAALGKVAINKANRLVTKIKTAQRKKLEAENGQLKKLKAHLFPAESLQERTENIAGFYAQYGPGILDLILENSLTFEQAFGIITLPDQPKPNEKF